MHFRNRVVSSLFVWTCNRMCEYVLVSTLLSAKKKRRQKENCGAPAITQVCLRCILWAPFQSPPPSLAIFRVSLCPFVYVYILAGSASVFWWSALLPGQPYNRIYTHGANMECVSVSFLPCWNALLAFSGVCVYRIKTKTLSAVCPNTHACNALIDRQFDIFSAFLMPLAYTMNGAIRCQLQKKNRTSIFCYYLLPCILLRRHLSKAK